MSGSNYQPNAIGDRRVNEAGDPIKMRDEDILASARLRLQEAYEADRENRRQAALDLSFLAGDQWDTATSEARRKARRPMLTINRLPSFVGQVVNDIRQADLEIRAVPVGEEDRALTDVYNGILRQIQHRSSAKAVYATCVSHQVSCGMGYFRVTTDYVDDDTFDQEIKIESIANPLSVYFDPGAVKPDRSDAMWALVTEEVPRKAFAKRYPKATTAADDMPVPTDYVRDNLHWYSQDTVRVAEYWVKEEVEREIIEGADGEIYFSDDLEDIELEVSEGKRRKVKTHKVKQYIVSGTEILEGPNEWAGRHIPIVPAFGQEVPLEYFRYRHGLVRFARDAQQLYNYYRTSSAEWVNLAPRAPFLVTKNQIGEYKRMWDDHNVSPRPYLVYEHDPEVPSGPRREQPPALPSALMAEAQVAVEDLKATTGIFDASLGNTSNERSGKAITARQREGDTANFHYVDNFERALEYCGRILIDLIPKIYDNDRVMRLVGENDKENVVPINRVAYSDDGEPVIYNDLSAGRFDVRVKIGPSYSTKREETAERLMMFMQHYPPAAELIGDLVAKNMDFPGADEMARRLEAVVPDEIKNYDPEGPPPPPPPPPPEMELEREKMQAEAQQTQMQTQTEQMRLQAEQQRLQMQMQFEHQKHQQKMAELAAQQRLEEMRAQIEAYRASIQGALVEQKAEADAEKVEHQADLARAKAKQQKDGARSTTD